MSTIRTSKITGKMQTFNATVVEKDRVKLLSTDGTALAIVYRRDTPTIKAGEGYKVVNIAAIVDQDAAKTCGNAMNLQRPSREKFSKNIIKYIKDL